MQAQGIAALAPGQAAPMQNPALQGQQPQGTNGGLPPDLKQLLAQQSRNELAQAAQRHMALQQALQMGQGQGKPPTVAQQVQMQGQREQAAVAGPAMQTQEQMKQAGLQQLMQAQRGVPERVPQPESQGIAELPVPEFGMAGGGIVSFANTGQVPSGVAGDIPGLVAGNYGDYQTSKPTEEEYENWWETVGKFLRGVADPVRAYMAQREAEMRGAPQPERVPQDTRKPPEAPIAPLPPENKPGELSDAVRALITKDAAEQGIKNPVMRFTPPAAGQQYMTEAERAAKLAVPSQPVRQAPAGRTPPLPEQPTAAGITAVLPQQPEQESPLRAPLEKSIMARMGVDPYAEAGTGVEAIRKQMGLEALMKQQQEVIDERKARQAAAAQQRLPAWVMGGLQATQPRGGGLGSLLASWGAGAAKAQQGYAAADEANAEVIDNLRLKMIEAQKSGNMEAAKQYGSLLERSLMGIGQAQQSGVGLLTKDEATAQRRESAAQAAIARVEAARERAAAMGLDETKIKALEAKELGEALRGLQMQLKSLPSFDINPEVKAERASLKRQIQALVDRLSGAQGAAAAPAGSALPADTTGWSAKLKK